MKKLLLLVLSVSVSASVYSQARKMAPGVQLKPQKGVVNPMKLAVPQEKTYAVPFDKQQLPETTVPVMMRSGSVITEAVLGQTVYDLQTNRGTMKRISNNLDGTLSAIWTWSATAGTTWPDRKTAYTYWDGTSWSAAVSVEPVRTGFTNIDYTAQAGEYISAHTGAAGVMLSHRATKGTGPWTFDTVGTFNLFTSQADVWSRMALGGSAGNTVHVIVNSQGTGTTPVIGMSGPLTYSRSLNGGDTWDKDHVVLPGDSADQYFGVGADEYHIDAKGDVIAIVEGGFTHDVVLYKSLDNGNTWTKTVIMAFPIPLYDDAIMNTDIDADGIADTIPTNAGDVTVTLDNNNVAHIAFGDMRVIEDIGATAVGFFPSTDGLMYWNENMGASAPVMVAAAEDFNGNGFIDIPENATLNPFGDYNVGICSQPSIGVDAANNIYLAYSTVDERTDTNSFQQILRHVFAIKSMDGGITWSTPLCVVPDPTGNGAFQEAVWPSVATVVDNCMHVVYMRDAAPGHSVLGAQTANNQNPSDIIYACVPPADFVMGVSENNNSNTGWVSANFPNPVNDVTSITVKLSKSSDLTIEITNMVGQVMMTEKKNALSAGSHTINLDMAHLDAGVYFYNVTAGDQSVCRKMVIE